MAIEALAYDRAQAFAAEMPPSEYDTWQPRKLLQVLLDIDPLADKDSTITFGIEPEYGVLPDKMQLLGSEKVLNAATLKKHYDALGNYLHMPTVRQLREGKGLDRPSSPGDARRSSSFLMVFSPRPCSTARLVCSRRLLATAART